MTTRNQKLNEKMDALLGGDADEILELDVEEDNSKAELAATQKLIQNHQDEYDFYVEYIKNHPAKECQDIPDSPIELTTFCMQEYLNAALAQVEYEKDEDMIVASVPNASGFYSQGESYEEARANLLDAIEGNVQIALQMGWDIPRFPGVDVRTSVVSSDPA